ncbi:MAG: YIP1 family protein [Lachnospiraceae bacterium]|nr:YIP1 family protein [Lachnospiraceae bacterium]
MKKYFSKDKWNFMFYTMTHPADGFYEIRHRDRGSVPLAVVMVILFSICYSMNRMLASFVVNDVEPRTVDSLKELTAVLLLYLLFCVGNWSITCLMEGEGRLKDIAIAVGYALVPMIVTLVPATILSQGIADNEEAFYTMLVVVGIAYSVIIALIGIMQVHNYTLGKTLIVLFLTFIAMFIIIFVCLLLTDLVNQIYNFFYSLYTEIIFRN